MKQICVHGLGQAPSDWEALLRLLDTPGESLCPDLAQLVPPEKTTYPALCRAFSWLCDGQAAPVALCGLSLGAVLALRYAAERPARVGALVLIAPQYRAPRRLLRVQNALFRVLPPAAFRGTGFTKDRVLQLCGSLMDLDLSEALRRVSCPVLVLCGSRDRANKRASAELAQLLSGAEFHIVEGAGHALNREAPEQLAALIRDFYARALPCGERGNGAEMPAKDETDRRRGHV